MRTFGLFPLPRRRRRFPGFALIFCLALLAATLSCGKAERWSAMVYAGETAFNHRDAGVYGSVEECLQEGRKQKGDGYLECGLNCRWTAQGLLDCEKTVRLVEHLRGEAPATAASPPPPSPGAQPPSPDPPPPR